MSTNFTSLRALLARIRAPFARRAIAGHPVDTGGPSLGSFAREQIIGPFATIGDFAVFAVATLAAMPRVFLHRTRFRELLVQLDTLGVGALPITHITGFITGLLLGLQTQVSLEQFGITPLFPQMLSIALIREVGPTFVALIAGARAASGIASELATMSVTQQVDAMRALGRSPAEFLAAPRVLAALIAFPSLSVAGLLAGYFGGMIIAHNVLGLGVTFFFTQAFLVLGIREILPNLIVKPAVFGLLIGLVAAYLGLHAGRGTRAVGLATVQAVVLVTVGVLIADYTVGELFREFWPPPPW